MQKLKVLISNVTLTLLTKNVSQKATMIVVKIIRAVYSAMQDSSKSLQKDLNPNLSYI